LKLLVILNAWKNYRQNVTKAKKFIFSVSTIHKNLMTYTKFTIAEIDEQRKSSCRLMAG
jgi:hypothetical protein